MFGPTLLDLAKHLSVGVGSLAIMFAVRAIGSAVGSVGSGVILDKMERFSYTLIAIIITGGIISKLMQLETMCIIVMKKSLISKVC